MNTAELYDKERSVAFYEERYARGSRYMDEWPIDKKRRIGDVIRELGLPNEGDAVDFGCGHGVVTEVLRQALPPAWKVYGVDVSETAIGRARERYPHCTFMCADDPALIGKRFDFVFTHHVLEHVYDVSLVLDEIVRLATPHGTMLHILPCGNAGSLEHQICLLRKDGINLSLENRFFFEDEGHVRRLTSAQLCRLCSDRGFTLADESYGNQYHGGVEWITRAGPQFIELLTNTAQAVGEEEQAQLKAIRFRLMMYAQLRRAVFELDNRLAITPKSWRNYVAITLLAPLYLGSKLIDLYLRRRAIVEWHDRKREPNGSEMYLYFRR
jgi:ubiquinone/menaquinone biosynthesis C-methylase UbiE